jgi:hypothetical protein
MLNTEMKGSILLIVLVLAGCVQETPAQKDTVQVVEHDSVLTATETDVQVCTSNPSPVLTHAFTDVPSIHKITPSGFWLPDVFKGHSFIWTDGENVPVYAPVDMQFTSGAYYTEHGQDQYVLYFTISCEVSLKFDHIHEPVQAIKEALPPTPKNDTRDVFVEPIAFKAGELIGHTRGNTPSGNWDFGLYNTAQPNSIEGISGRDRTANCPFNYYQDNVYEKLYDGASLLCMTS